MKAIPEDAKKTAPSENAAARMDIEGLSFAYESKAVLENVDFAVPHGASVAVVGPNGAGKSTLLKILVGLLRPSAGRVLVHGLPIGSHKDCVAYVPQREEIDWRFPLTVADAVRMGRYGRNGWFRPLRADDATAVAAAMDRLGIADLARRPLSDLSGGQQQRVFLARALAQEPHILLLDEPFSGMDAVSQAAYLDILGGLRRDGVTILAATHDLNLARTRFDLVLLLRRRVVAFGPPSEAINADSLADTFGSHVLRLDDAVVVDECCSHGEGGDDA